MIAPYDYVIFIRKFRTRKDNQSPDVIIFYWLFQTEIAIFWCESYRIITIVRIYFITVLFPVELSCVPYVAYSNGFYEKSYYKDGSGRRIFAACCINVGIYLIAYRSLWCTKQQTKLIDLDTV